jgi:hypothetical protein
MLTLLTLDTRTQQCKQRTFTIVDLAGAERPEKALGERISKDKAIQEMFRYLKTPSADSARGPAQKPSSACPCPGPFWTLESPLGPCALAPDVCCCPLPPNPPPAPALSVARPAGLLDQL